MQPQSAQKVYELILAHIQKQGGPFSSWFVGITADWETSLFEDHRIPHDHYWCTVHKCYYDTDAKGVAYSLISLGCDSYEIGGNEDTVYVYAYLKGPMTNP